MKKTALLVVTMLATVGVARADIDPILTRQAGQDLVAGTFAGINNVVKLKGDVKTLEKPALYMQKWSAVFPTLFPKGSESGHNTKAKPEIWSDMAGFEKASARFGEASGKLAAAAKEGDVEAVTVAVKGISDACANCHDNYRNK